MPTRFNTDHQAAVLDWIEHVVVQPGESHEFTDEEIAAGLAGSWSETDPRAGLSEEQEFKRLRDASRAELDDEARSLSLDPSQYPNKQAVIEAIKAAKSSPSPDETPDDEVSSDDETDRETSA